MRPPHDALDRQEFTAVLYQPKIIIFLQDVWILCNLQRRR
jgi:hypothetical protein